MLQQTPVPRVLPVYQAWLDALARSSGDLASRNPSGEAVRAWGRLGYPRRALRLHGAATAIAERHAGIVLADYDEPQGPTGYRGLHRGTAVASFAYGRRHAVLDTNVRRVLARACTPREQYPATAVSAAERALAGSLDLPEEPAHAAAWAAASMELGALVCTAKSPRCDGVPDRRAVRLARGGQPRVHRPCPQGPELCGHRAPAVRQRFLLAVLRDAATRPGRGGHAVRRVGPPTRSSAAGPCAACSRTDWRCAPATNHYRFQRPSGGQPVKPMKRRAPGTVISR